MRWPQIELEPPTREMIEAARRMSPGERMGAGAPMFEDGCAEIRARLRAGLKVEDDRIVEALLKHIIDYAEERGIL